MSRPASWPTSTPWPASTRSLMSSPPPLALQDFGPDLHVDVADALPPPSVSILGIPLAITDYERTMDWMDATIVDGGQGYVCVAATHTVMACQEAPDLREAVVRSDLTVPDGQPLVWAMNALGHNLTSRVYGPDLMARYCEHSITTRTKMFLYGARNQGALVQLALDLRRRYPGLQIVGGYAPRTARSPPRSRGQSSPRSTARARMSSGSASACPSRRSGWPRCARTSALRCSSASAPRSTSTRDSCRRRRRGCSPWGWNGPTASRASTPAVEALPALQPTLRHRLRAAVGRERPRP